MDNYKIHFQKQENNAILKLKFCISINIPPETHTCENFGELGVSDVHFSSLGGGGAIT